jgi:hypothetical protein
MIGFESEDTYVRRLGERLHAMDDAELIAFGKNAKNLVGMRVSTTVGSIPMLVFADQVITIAKKRVTLLESAVRWGSRVV